MNDAWVNGLLRGDYNPRPLGPDSSTLTTSFFIKETVKCFYFMKRNQLPPTLFEHVAQHPFFPGTSFSISSSVSAMPWSAFPVDLIDTVSASASTPAEDQARAEDPLEILKKNSKN